jgi:hypothetical protein
VPRWALTKDQENKCIHCNAVGTQGEWPNAEVTELISFIRNYDSGSPHYNQVACVFTSSLLELLLEELLTNMAYMGLTFDQASILVDALIEAHQGRSRML